MDKKQIEEIDELTSVLYEANHKKSVLDYHWLATEAYNAGYRKASDVAREILALIWDAYQTTHYDSEFEERFDKIAKKYESEGGE